MSPAYEASLKVFREVNAKLDREFRAALREQLSSPDQVFFTHRYLDEDSGQMPALMTATPELLAGNFWIGFGLSHYPHMDPEDWPTFMWGSVVYDEGDHDYGRHYPWELSLDPRRTATARDPQILAAMCIAATKEWILREARRAA